MKNINDIESLLARDLSGENLTENQKNALQEWISANREEYDSLRSIMRETDIEQNSKIVFDSNVAWKKVEPQLISKMHFSSRIVSLSLVYAASILLLIGLTILLNRNIRTDSLSFENTSASIEKIMLPDSSFVNLYPGANIQYKAKDKSGKREVALTGKAFFKVTKDGRPFVIEAYNMNIEVLGTSFLVEACGKDSASVHVKTGLVKVKVNSQSVLLEAGKQVKVSGKKMIESTITYPEYLFSEKPNNLKFENSSMTEVVGRLEVIFNVKIDLDEKSKECRVTTQIEIDNLQEILTELSYICNCEYDKIAENHYKFYCR